MIGRLELLEILSRFPQSENLIRRRTARLAMRPGEGGQPAMSAPGMHTLPTPSFVGQPVEQPQMYMVPMALVQQGRSPPQGGAAHLQPMQPMRMQHPSALDGRGQPHVVDQAPGGPRGPGRAARGGDYGPE